MVTFVKIERELEAERQREKLAVDRGTKESEKRRIRIKYFEYTLRVLLIGLLVGLGFYAMRLSDDRKLEMEERKLEVERVLAQARDQCDEVAQNVFNNESSPSLIISVTQEEAVLKYWNRQLKNRRYFECTYSAISGSVTTAWTTKN